MSISSPAGARSREDSISRQSGLTLVEIIITLAVIGLSAGIFVTNMGGLTKKERLKTAARKMAGISDFVRSFAAGSKAACYLQIDFVKNRYRYFRDPMQDSFGRFIDSEDGHLLTEEEIEEWEDSFEWEDLPRDVYFRKLWFSHDQAFDQQNKAVTVTYWPDGSVQSYTLWLQGAAEDGQEGAYYSVVVNGLSGNSEVLDYAATPPSASEGDFTSVMSDPPGGNSGPGGAAGSGRGGGR